MERRPTEPLQLRRAAFVLMLVFMLSFNPALNTAAVRIEPVGIEFVVQGKRRRRRRHGRPAAIAFVTRESSYTLGD